MIKYSRRPTGVAMTIRYTIVLTLLLLAIPEPGWSYVDPGITGMIYQIGFLVIASVSALLALFRHPSNKQTTNNNLVQQLAQHRAPSRV